MSPAAVEQGAARPPSAPLPSVTVAKVRFDAVTERGCIEHILAALDRGEGGWVVTVNLDLCRRAGRDPSFGAIVASADLVVADGMPLVWCAALQRTPLPERVAGSNLTFSLSAAAASRGRSVFLLGGAPGAASGACDALRERCPGITIAGSHVPPFGFEDDPSEMAAIESAIREAAPDIIYVALGSPKQEHLIRRVRSVAPDAWWLGVGISFSFLAGEVTRAPRWMQRLGLEWTHRLVQEPGRLARRYLLEGIPFALRILAASACRGLLPSRQEASADSAGT